jgi:pimeloyl-ACP methyl ester carboxylesterase
MPPSKPFSQLAFDELPEEPRRPHRFFEMDARDIEVADDHFGSVSTHVRTFGAGPPLLLVHGLMTSSYSWRYVLEPLGEHFTLYVPDLPGAGRSARVLEPSYEPRAMARWIAALQRELGIYGCDVVGNSMGGYLAMWLALQDPEAMRSLVNLHSPGVPIFRLHALRAAMRVPGTRRLAAWLARRDPERWAHRNVHYYDETLKSREEAREYGRPLSTKAGADAFVKYLAETMNAKYLGEFCRELERRRTAGGFPVPLLLVYARQDPMVPPIVGERLEALVPDAEFVWLEEASHFAHVDATDRFVQLAADFLVDG